MPCSKPDRKECECDKKKSLIEKYRRFCEENPGDLNCKIYED